MLSLVSQSEHNLKNAFLLLLLAVQYRQKQIHLNWFVCCKIPKADGEFQVFETTQVLAVKQKTKTAGNAGTFVGLISTVLYGIIVT